MILEALSTLALAAATPLDATAPTPTEVTIDRHADGQLVAHFRFQRAARAWAFFRSAVTERDKQPWRPRSWEVLTPGVRLERHGNYDALVAANGASVPVSVEIAINPFKGALEGDYVPAMSLGGSALALFDGEYALFPVKDVTQLDNLAADPPEGAIDDPGTHVRFRASRGGVRLVGDIEGFRKGESEGAYALFDLPQPKRAGRVATIIDQDMPPWLHSYLTGYTSRMIQALDSRLWPVTSGNPTVIAAWEGSDRPGHSFNGGALKGLVMVRLEGRGAVTEDLKLRDEIRWFIAHEVSHFWLGQSIDAPKLHDRWIVEGGADLLALRTIAAVDPNFDPRPTLNHAIADCASAAKVPISSAGERGDFRTFYACGALFALVAEARHPQGWFGFVKDLRVAARSDGSMDANIWLATLDHASGDPALSRRIRDLLDSAAANPNKAISDLLNAAAIPHRLTDNGVPTV